MLVTWPPDLSGLAWGLQASQLGEGGKITQEEGHTMSRSLSKEILLNNSLKPKRVGTKIVQWTDLG